MSVGPVVSRKFFFFYLFGCVLTDFRFQDIIWNWAQQNQGIWHQRFSYARVGEKTESLWMSPSLLHYHSTGVGNLVFVCQTEQDHFLFYCIKFYFIELCGVNQLCWTHWTSKMAFHWIAQCHTCTHRWCCLAYFICLFLLRLLSGCIKEEVLLCVMDLCRVGRRYYVCSCI